MNKSELIERVSAESGLSKAQTSEVLDAFIKAITTSLNDGQVVSLIGFGTFQVKDRAARQGRNPQTGETMLLPAKRVPVFKAGKGLKDKVNS